MASRTPVLIMLQGEEPGSRYRLRENRVTTIGRSTQNEISLLDRTVSRFHCEITYINGLWYIHDLHSRAGTLVNGEKVTQRRVLSPGDIIRISSNVFRFDVVEEKQEEDERLVGVQEAILDRRIRVKGAAKASLDHVRQRSLMEIDSESERRSGILNRAIAINALFVAGVSMAVALCVIGVLVWGTHRAKKQQRLQDQRRLQVEERYRDAVALFTQQPRKAPEAIRLLRSLVDDYPDTPTARKAARKLVDLEWEHAERELEQISRLEEEQHYRKAAQRYTALLELSRAPGLQELLALRLDFVERLARAAFRQVKDEAERILAQKGDPEAVRALYEKAKEDLGVASLADEIEERLQNIPPGKDEQQGGAEGGMKASTRTMAESINGK